uniref:WW domain-binding protein 4 n=1 Tax=Myxine glutinosa TaxID=7769 RepID=UPI00358E071A
MDKTEIVLSTSGLVESEGSASSPQDNEDRKIFWTLPKLPPDQPRTVAQPLKILGVLVYSRRVHTVQSSCTVGASTLYSPRIHLQSSRTVLYANFPATYHAMSEFWKSQPRKFCDFCKCWFGDNKPSIDFHERGKNHQENVKRKLDEIRRRGTEQAKLKATREQDFASMEKAAEAAYQRDLERLGFSSGNEKVAKESCNKKPKSNPTKTNLRLCQRKEEAKMHAIIKVEKVEKGAEVENAATVEGNVWVRCQSEDGSTYYYNTASAETSWEPPAGFIDDVLLPWVTGWTSEGWPYFFNPVSGESCWERPVADNADVEESGCAESQEMKINKGEENVGGEATEEGHEQHEVKVEVDMEKKEVVDEGAIEVKIKVEDEECSGVRPLKIKFLEKAPQGKESKTQEPHEGKILKMEAKRRDAYGEWQEVRKEDNKFPFDLQLPCGPCDRGNSISTDEARSLKKKRPQLILQEKTVPSLAGLVSGDTFKTRTQDGAKTRNIRKRTVDA